VHICAYQGFKTCLNKFKICISKKMFNKVVVFYIFSVFKNYCESFGIEPSTPPTSLNGVNTRKHHFVYIGWFMDI
jgi:hypothetical protein